MLEAPWHQYCCLSALPINTSVHCQKIHVAHKVASIQYTTISLHMHDTAQVCSNRNSLIHLLGSAAQAPTALPSDSCLVSVQYTLPLPHCSQLGCLISACTACDAFLQFSYLLGMSRTAGLCNAAADLRWEGCRHYCISLVRASPVITAYTCLFASERKQLVSRVNMLLHAQRST